MSPTHYWQVNNQPVSRVETAPLVRAARLVQGTEHRRATQRMAPLLLRYRVLHLLTHDSNHDRIVMCACTICNWPSDQSLLASTSRKAPGGAGWRRCWLRPAHHLLLARLEREERGNAQKRADDQYAFFLHATYFSSSSCSPQRSISACTGIHATSTAGAWASLRSNAS